MRILVDTHVLLWWFGSSDRLPAQHAALIEDARNDLWVSAASAWEFSIKQNLGKLGAPDDFRAAVVASGFDELAISHEHALTAGQLPLLHRDPFDRLLVAQAQIEQMAIMTVDPVFDAYDVATV